MELAAGAYGSVRTEDDVPAAPGNTRRVSVETFSSFSRKDAPVQHSLAKTMKTSIEVGHHGDDDGDDEDAAPDGGEPAWKARVFALAAPAVAARPGDGDVLKAHVSRCTRLSLWINVALTCVKLYNVLTSGSLAVLASLVDSCLDLAQTLVLFVVERKAHLAADEEYPAGRSRLEPVGVIVCAMLMAVGSLGVIYDAGGSVVEGATRGGNIPTSKGSELGRVPLVSADSWTSDRLSGRSRSVDAFPGTRARETLTLKRR